MKNLTRVLFCVLCFLFLFSGGRAGFAAAGYVDTHIHFDPRVKLLREEMAKNIIAQMDAAGVEKAVIMPPPQVYFQKGAKNTFAECSRIAAAYPGRLYVGSGGDVLNPLINEYSKDEVTPEIKARLRKKAEELVKEGIVAFGEMAALHLSMARHHIFSQAAPDHPLFLLLADIAAENNIPIDLHMEAVPENIPTPHSLIKISPQNPNTLNDNIRGLERLLEHNPGADIVWQHIGWDNIGYMRPGLIAELLGKHPNLYVALRVERRQAKMDGSAPMENRIVDGEWNVRPEWRKLITDFSDRIVVGSDDFMGRAGQKPRPKDSFMETWSILEQFPPEIAQKIGRDNAVRIYHL